jgi:hypothetical protein
MDKLQLFFDKTSQDTEIYVCYKNSNVCSEKLSLILNGFLTDKTFTILMPKLNKYPSDVIKLINITNCRIYEVSSIGLNTVLKKRCHEYAKMKNAVFIPDKYYLR